jgi:hypothetical protein
MERSDEGHKSHMGSDEHRERQETVRWLNSMSVASERRSLMKTWRCPIFPRNSKSQKGLVITVDLNLLVCRKYLYTSRVTRSR